MSLLDVRNITKAFGSNTAVDDVSLTIQRGEFLGLIGSNGAGKTTLVNLISGFFPADRGALVLTATTSRASPSTSGSTWASPAASSW
jgi:ABC-type branched-subunit amino acid transport system ATPase component